MISIKVNAESLERALGKKAQAAIKRAVVRTVNTAITSGSSAARKEISRQIGTKQKDIKSRIKIKRATSSDPRASLTFIDRGISAEKLKPKRVRVMTTRGQRWGVSIQIKGERKLLPGAFMGNANKRVWERVGKRRKPIKLSRVPSITALLDESVLMQVIQKVVTVSVQKNLQSNINFYAEKVGK